MGAEDGRKKRSQNNKKKGGKEKERKIPVLDMKLGGMLRNDPLEKGISGLRKRKNQWRRDEREETL